jgi:hypothetical protein
MSEHPQRKVAENSPDFQDRDIHLKPIILFGVVTVLFLVATYAGIRLLFVRMEANLAGGPPTPLAAERVLPPEPRLQISERKDLVAHLAWEDEQLGRYAWVDKAAGKVQIPIEVAIKQVAAQGLPLKGRAAPASATSTNARSPAPAAAAPARASGGHP